MDYYELLEVSKTASHEEIKKKYKELAMRYHPDKNKSPDAEAKFKSIAQAYQVLSDKDKRRTYDLTGNIDDFASITKDDIFAELFGRGGMPDINDILSNLMGDDGGISFQVYTMPFEFSMQSPLSEKKRTDDVYYNIYASLEDIYQAKAKTIRVEHYRNLGAGKFKKTPVELQLDLSKREMIFEGMADEIENHQPGNIIVNIFAKPHPKFKRINESDLVYHQEITLDELYNGGQFALKHLNGKEYNVKFELKLDNYEYQRIKGLGFDGGGGDLYIHYKILFPPSLQEIKQRQNDKKEEKQEIIIPETIDYADVHKEL